MRASTISTLLGAGVVALLAVVGCGKSDSEGAGDKDQFIAQLCAEFSDCCKAAGRPSDGAQCRAFYGAFTPATGYDQTAATACLEEVRATGGNKCEAGSSNTPSCRKVFESSGTKQPGETCDDDSDCAPAESGESACASSFVGGATVQQCQTRLVGKAGSSPCIGTIEGSTTFFSNSDEIATTGYTCDVADGLACDDATGACTALAAIGETCSGGGFYQCVAGAYCSQGTCRGRVAVGSACTFGDDCVDGASCSQDSQTCVALLAAGAACTSSSDCASSNCTNQKCSANDDLSLTFLCGSN
jgi:hypothetical protein